MSRDIFALLASNRFIVGDGAMGTMLQQAGIPPGGAPELWNVERPEVIRGIYQSYVDAGSQMIETNTFGGTGFRLKLHNLQDRAAELNRAGAALAREVAGEDVLAAGSIGPSGELIEPIGALTFEAAVDGFAEQAAALAEGGVDLFVIETMSDLNEVKAAIDGCRRVSDLPIAVTMTFDTNYHTMMGVHPAVAVRTLADWGVRIIGANCGNGPAEIREVMREMVAVRPASVYLMAQSNAGLPKWSESGIYYDGTPPVMADYAIDMASMGVNIIGACCGSTPDHIRAMREALLTRPIPVYQPEGGTDSAIESDEHRAARRAERRAGRRER